MADTTIKKWNGTAWEDVYPETTVGQIQASGTPSSSTYLRGDGTWATVTATGDIEGVTAGSGLTGGGTSGTVTLSHADTSSAANLSASGRTYVTGLTFDTYGHVTGYSTGTETVVDTNTTYTAGSGLTLSGTQFSHTDTSSQGSVNNSNGTVIQDVTLDTYGHVTGLASVDLDGRYYTESEADGRFVNVTGDTMTGSLTTSSYLEATQGVAVWNGSLNIDTDYQDRLWATSIGTETTRGTKPGNYFHYVNLPSNGTTRGLQFGGYYGGNNDLYVRTRTDSSGGSWLSWAEVWTSQSDGSGSGLDADLLDGNHASAFYLATNPSGYTTNTGTVTSVATGGGLTGGTITTSGTISHADTSAQASVNNSGATVIQDVTLDTYGHVTGLASVAITPALIGAQAAGTYDNYSSWTLQAQNSAGTSLGTSPITSGDTAVFKAGSNVTLAWADDTITISSTNTDTTYSAGGGLTLSGTQFSHTDTSSAANLTASGRRYVTGLTFDTYGHVTGYTTGTETVVDTNTTYSAGGGLTLSGTTFSHTDTSAQASVNNSGNTMIQDITLDTYGHITGIVSASVGWTWEQIRGRSANGTLTSTGTSGSLGGSIAAGATLAQGDTIMMEVGDNTSVSAGYNPNIILFTLGAADTIPTGVNQGVEWRSAYANSTLHYHYSFKVGYSSSTLYFDDAFRWDMLDSSTASSIITTATYTLHVGRIWRLKA